SELRDLIFCDDIDDEVALPRDAPEAAALVSELHTACELIVIDDEPLRVARSHVVAGEVVADEWLERFATVNARVRRHVMHDPLHRGLRPRPGWPHDLQ